MMKKSYGMQKDDTGKSVANPAKKRFEIIAWYPELSGLFHH